MQVDILAVLINHLWWAIFIVCKTRSCRSIIVMRVIRLSRINCQALFDRLLTHLCWSVFTGHMIRLCWAIFHVCIAHLPSRQVGLTYAVFCQLYSCSTPFSSSLLRL